MECSERNVGDSSLCYAKNTCITKYNSKALNAARPEVRRSGGIKRNCIAIMGCRRNGCSETE